MVTSCCHRRTRAALESTPDFRLAISPAYCMARVAAGCRRPSLVQTKGLKPISASCSPLQPLPARRIKVKGKGNFRHWIPTAVQRACWGRNRQLVRRRCRGKTKAKERSYFTLDATVDEDDLMQFWQIGRPKL